MSSTGSNKTWLYVVGAAGALVTAAVIFHLASNKVGSSS
jgi:hypothetical protein